MDGPSTAPHPLTLSTRLLAAHQAPMRRAGPRILKAMKCTPCPLPTHSLIERSMRKKSSQVQHGLCQRNHRYGQPLGTNHACPAEHFTRILPVTLHLDTILPTCRAEMPRLRDVGLSTQLVRAGLRLELSFFDYSALSKDSGTTFRESLGKEVAGPQAGARAVAGGASAADRPDREFQPCHSFTYLSFSHVK